MSTRSSRSSAPGDRSELAVRLYFDHNVSRAIVHGLRLRGVDVLAAYEDGTHLLPDEALLKRASSMGRVLVSSDVDLIVEARVLQRAGIPFAGVIFAPQELAVGQCIEELELAAEAGTPADFADSLLFLPLR